MGYLAGYASVSGMEDSPRKRKRGVQATHPLLKDTARSTVAAGEVNNAESFDDKELWLIQLPKEVSTFCVVYFLQHLKQYWYQ